MGAETDFEAYWKGVLECSYGYVLIMIRDGKVQTEMKKWMKKQEEFVKGTSSWLQLYSRPQSQRSGKCSDSWIRRCQGEGRRWGNCTTGFCQTLQLGARQNWGQRQT